MDEWQTIQRRIAYECGGFDVVNETVELPDGTDADFDYLLEGESVVVLPFTTEQEGEAVVVIDEWRHAVRRTNRGLPAGSIESGEDPERAVPRELREETGYTPGDIEHLTTMEPANGFSDTVFHYYVARDCRQVSEQSLDRDETIEVSTMPYGDLLDAVESGELRDGRSAFAILYYERFHGRHQ